ncbi:hypothetical protein B9G98_04575 [Wickerhamiella sorbophila]|uniref:Uncharacterized protein n=1 Tax=Wickerhamiella sorbophila TaxID=45607 RepID=A0A2T0FPQ6_9ASCO|nr:hypothetical protein B9G98_04575 [Wickerhamiella sorbophila]PRT56955.1 hypothetical protein B9G98_04575 [Wickerhamiella sorbophila]
MAIKELAELLRRAAEYARRGLTEVARLRDRRLEPSWEPAYAHRRGRGRKGFRHSPFGCWQRAYFHSYSNPRRPRRHHHCPWSAKFNKIQKRFFAHFFRGGFYSNVMLTSSATLKTCIGRGFSKPLPVWLAGLFVQTSPQVKPHPRHTFTPRGIRLIISAKTSSSPFSLIKLNTERSISSFAKPRETISAKFEQLAKLPSAAAPTVSSAVSGLWLKEDNLVSQEAFVFPSVPGTESNTAAVDFDMAPNVELPNEAELDGVTTQTIVTALERQIERLRTMISDVQQISELGVLPLSVENGGRTVRVHFPNSNPESVNLLMQDQEISTGRIVDVPSSQNDMPPVSDIEWADDTTPPELSFSISTASTLSESFSLV